MRRSLRVAAFALFVTSLAAAVLTLVPRRGQTVPLYAARTGLQCGTCHFDPNGGGPRNEFGFGFAKNRHALEPEGEGSPWKDLALTNRVGDTMPVYFGVNHRFMALSSDGDGQSGVERFGFYNMESSLFMAFQPHAKLTLVYARDGFNDRSSTKEAFGMISGLPLNGYVKAGQFRPPFGLRMDDHTVATRNSFLDLQTGDSFLPYDPRRVDQGLEVGGECGGIFGRAAWLAGGTSPAGDATSTQTAAVKLGYNTPGYQGGVSLYTRAVGGEPDRESRWGYYGLTHVGPVALLGEVAAGTDEVSTGDPLDPTVNTNKLAWFVEADWQVKREYNMRVRMDRVELDRNLDDAIRARNSFNRYGLEGEWVPVPFAEIRWAMRLVDPFEERDALGRDVPNEKQGYIQFHFSY